LLCSYENPKKNKQREKSSRGEGEGELLQVELQVEELLGMLPRYQYPWFHSGV
jgi:hypothetical protein